MNGWQPIETAPKDGTEILIRSKWGNIRHVRWNPDLWQGCWSPPDDELLAINPHFGMQPHWMPLPEPPEVSSQ